MAWRILEVHKLHEGIPLLVSSMVPSSKASSASRPADHALEKSAQGWADKSVLLRAMSEMGSRCWGIQTHGVVWTKFRAIGSEGSCS